MIKLVERAVNIVISCIRIQFTKLLHPSAKICYSRSAFITCSSKIALIKKDNKTPSLKIGSKSKIDRTLLRCSGGGKLSIGIHCDIKSSSLQANGGQLIIGDDCFFNTGCIITTTNNIVVGSGCAFGTNVSIYDHDHIYVRDGIQPWNQSKSEPVIIGKNCWIGCNVVILRGTIIGDNCVVAAGTVLKGKYDSHQIIYNERNTRTKDIK